MSISILKSNNLEKLLDGLSLLDERDQEQVFSVVEALGFADKKAEKAVCTNSAEHTRKTERK